MTTTEEKLKILIDEKIVERKKVTWGNGLRDVVIISHIKHQLGKNGFSKTLENKINHQYIVYLEMVNKQEQDELAKKKEETKKKQMRKINMLKIL